MHRRTLASLAIATATLLASVAPAAAITKTYEKDFEHPFVGLFVGYDAAGEFAGRCSGSLLSPTVFLTAGHCVVDDAGEMLTSGRVYFQQDAGAHYDTATELDPVSGYPEYCAAGTLGTLCATSDELYSYGFLPTKPLPETQDVAVVILDQPIDLPEYAQLPEAGVLDPLATGKRTRELAFAVSGYGVTRTNPVQFESYRERLMALSILTNLRSALTGGFNLQTNGNGLGLGGTCGGDSGGPVFFPADSNVVVAVTSFGLNDWCRGTDFAYRVDQAAVLAWLDQWI